MRLALGSDHRGDEAIARLAPRLRDLGHDITVFGPCDGTRRDYPDEAYIVGHAVAAGQADRGILVCGSGIGVCIAANKVKGVRAALVNDAKAAEMSRRHNDANVLCLSGDAMPPEEVDRAVEAFIKGDFEGGRHARRIEKIKAIEQGSNPSTISSSTTR